MQEFDNNTNNNSATEDMSMEDILASIRKYVAEDDAKKTQQTPSNKESNNNVEHRRMSAKNGVPPAVVVKLDESQVVQDDFSQGVQQEKNADNHNFYEIPEEFLQKKEIGSNPFNKLTHAIKTYAKNPKKDQEKAKTVTVDNFLKDLATSMIEEWIDNNLEKVVAYLVEREIEKLKNQEL